MAILSFKVAAIFIAISSFNFNSDLRKTHATEVFEVEASQTIGFHTLILNFRLFPRICYVLKFQMKQIILKLFKTYPWS